MWLDNDVDDDVHDFSDGDGRDWLWEILERESERVRDANLKNLEKQIF